MGILGDVWSTAKKGARIGLGAKTGGLSEIGFGILGANKAAEDASKIWDSVDVPGINEQSIDPTLYSDGDWMVPENAVARYQGDSNTASVRADPAMRESQLRSLRALEGKIAEGGLDAVDRAKLEEANRAADVGARGRRGAITDAMRSRGLGGSGLEFAALMDANSEANRTLSDRSLDTAALAEDRRMQALDRASQLAGNIETRDVGLGLQKAQAQDAIDQFNTSVSNEMGVYNANNRNAALKDNIARRNQVSDANTQVRNDAQAYNKGLYQQRFENQSKVAGGKSGAYQNEGAQKSGQALGVLKTATDTAKSGLGALGMMSDERSKTDVEDARSMIDEFLKSLQPKSYRYKEPEKYGAGKQLGFMAQDLEREPVSESWVQEDNEGTKRVDYSRAIPAILAALARIDEKVG